MIDFSDFIQLCQRQLQPFLKISSPEELQLFNKKLRQMSLSLKHLCPEAWCGWKSENGISDTWDLVSQEAENFLAVIDAFEFSENGQDIVIYLGQEKKSFSLIDPVHFIKSNFYDREDIYFYLLLGEMMLEENLSRLQLYGAIARVRDLSQN